VTPVLETENCRQKLPAWGVTREFRFGQFIRLYDERVIGGRRQTTPIVLTVDGDIVETPKTASSSQALTATSEAAPSGPPQSTAAAQPLETLGLHVVAADPDLDQVVGASPDLSAAVTDVDSLLRSGMLGTELGTLEVDIGAAAAARLRRGESVMVVGRGADGGGASVVRVVPQVTDVTFSADDLDRWLAERAIPTERGPVALDEIGMRSLLTTGELVAPIAQNGQVMGLVRVTPAEGRDAFARPAAERIAITDLAEFLTYPIIPSTSGGSLLVNLDADTTRLLRLGEEVSLFVGDREVRFVCPEGPDIDPPEDFVLLGRARPVDPLDIKYDLRKVNRELYDTKTAGKGGAGSVDGKTQAQPKDDSTKLAREGLPVAVLLPWKQSWTLKGFSRGNLLSTLALAPGEETTITVASWERRSKALQQTAETDIEQTFDFTSTTRDTEDVFREITTTNDFNAQAHGSLDASYSPGVASIRVEAGGQVSNAQSLATACRTSTQHVRETTSRASTRVRSRRITTITESIERESRTSVVRQIRNPNPCHTLTMNFHEVLAHYDVSIEFIRPGVRIVVLVPNPVVVSEFDELTVRVNEATLRTYLLDPALVDGFEACRLLEAYRCAEEELRRLAGLSKAEKELDRERTESNDPSQPTKPENPHLAPLLSILADIKRRAAPFAGVDVGPALAAIAAKRTPNPTETVGAQRWLWRRLVAAKFGGGLLTELDGLGAKTTLQPSDARSLIAAIPAPGSFPALDGLGGLSDQEKEDAGLAARIKSMPGYMFWDWGPFWYPNCKRDGLYDVEDGGLPGALAQLRTTFQAWETKETEGVGLQAAAAVVEQAKGEQAATTLADRLEMKFGVETVGAAMERSEALRAHLNLHRDYYRYVLFQAMPPSEQLQRLLDVAPQLRVGMFEPHVVASDGPNLAIPLSPLVQTTLMSLVTNLSDELEQAATEAEAAGEQIAVDSVIFPTPGVSVESWLGECSGCEEHLEKLRTADERVAEAEARVAELEGDRRSARLEADNYDDPSPTAPPELLVRLTQSPPP
jgi:hypothetical protein